MIPIFDKSRPVSASNLPSEFTISDPRDFVKEFRASFLRNVREGLGLTLADVVAKAGASEDDLRRVEGGVVAEGDMALLHALAAVYGVDYRSLLSLFRLARPVSAANESTYRLAAYHDPKVGQDAQKAIADFLHSLKP